MWVVGGHKRWNLFIWWGKGNERYNKSPRSEENCKMKNSDDWETMDPIYVLINSETVTLYYFIIGQSKGKY